MKWSFNGDFIGLSSGCNWDIVLGYTWDTVGIWRFNGVLSGVNGISWGFYGNFRLIFHGLIVSYGEEYH